MKIIGWWSGGVTSAVACKMAADIYGLENCRFIFMDTKNEHKDTYRFKADCEKWYGAQIETISAIGNTYNSIQDVWQSHNSLNVANGAICSDRLKRKVREVWEDSNSFDHQVFGFEFEPKEQKRAKSMLLNHSHTNPIFPLIEKKLSKTDCFKILGGVNIEIPEMYKLGFKNNNCFGTGCVQGGIGYWQKMKREFPDKFEAMAKMEHKLTNKSGFPVTMLKDQSNKAKAKAKKDKYSALVFLKKHPKYPNKSIDDMRECDLEPLVDCNGFCGIDELSPISKTHKELAK